MAGSNDMQKVFVLVTSRWNKGQHTLAVPHHLTPIAHTGCAVQTEEIVKILILG